MRIACIHIPQFPLQAALRARPTLVGLPVVVLAAQGSASPVVVACSRAAHLAGARLGMSGPAVRSLASAVTVLTRDRDDEERLVAAVADAVAALSSDIRGRVERGGEPSGPHHALFVAVPSRIRGAAFGERLRTAMNAVSVCGRIGVADDRFTAWVAAAQPGQSPRQAHLQSDFVSATGSTSDVVSVPTGGAAHFLAPQPLSLLSIPAEVQHMLATLGVRTLGQFAALPPPTAARAWDSDYQALARGEVGATLTPSPVDTRPVREELELVANGSTLQLGLGAAIALLATRAAARVGARALAEQALITCFDDRGGQLQLAVPVSSDPAVLGESLRAALSDQVNNVVHIRLLIEVIASSDDASEYEFNRAAWSSHRPEQAPLRRDERPRVTETQRWLAAPATRAVYENTSLSNSDSTNDFEHGTQAHNDEVAANSRIANCGQLTTDDRLDLATAADSIANDNLADDEVAGPAPLRLEAPRPRNSSISAMAQLPHRRTRKGKQRTRTAVAAQARLFASFE